MKKLKTLLIALLAFAPLLLSSCSGSTQTYKTFSEIDGNPVGCSDGSPSFSEQLKRVFPHSPIKYFKSFSELIYATENGIISGFIADDPTYRYMRYNEHSKVVKLEEAMDYSEYAYIFRKYDSASDVLRGYLNQYIINNRESINQLADKWFPNDYDQTKNARVEEITTFSDPLGSFTAGVIDENCPMGFSINNTAQGFDADVLIAFAKAMRFNITLKSISVNSIFAELDEGRCDIIGGGFNITESRRENYNFSTPNYTGNLDFIVYDPTVPNNPNPIITGFYKTFIEADRWKTLLAGTAITLGITIISVIVGTFLGYGLYILGFNNKIARKIINGLTIFFSRTPIVVILMIFYYMIFGKSGMAAWIVALITFILAFSLTMNGLIKHGTDTIDRNQFDSMYALGYKKTQGFNKIIFPQSLRNFAPNYADEVVSLIKATSVVGFITVIDLTKATDLIRAASFQTFFPLFTSAIIYFLLATLLIFIVRLIDKKLNPFYKHELEMKRGDKKCSK